MTPKVVTVSEPEHRPDPDPAQWADPTVTYDVVAGDYAARFVDELSYKPFDRDLLTRYAAAVAPRASAARPVCDLGCGPGHIGAFVAAQGVDVVGLDLSPGMVAQAGRSFPGLTFGLGDMTALDRPDGSLAGIVCFYALIHIPRSLVPVALAEMRRTLVADGPLLLAVHGGTGSLHATEMVAHPVSLDATLFTLDELTGLVTGVGFEITEAHERQPHAEEVATQRLYVWATARP
jgi:SAM-dependent methyltransferase